MDSKMFALRLAELRISKGLSAREMSLSLGQSPGYISNIENAVNLPSMSSFFEICDFLQVTLAEFFSTDEPLPEKTRELLIAARSMRPENLDHLIALVKLMK